MTGAECASRCPRRRNDQRFACRGIRGSRVLSADSLINAVSSPRIKKNLDGFSGCQAFTNRGKNPSSWLNPLRPGSQRGAASGSAAGVTPLVVEGVGTLRVGVPLRQQGEYL